MFPWDIVILDPPKTYTQDGVCFITRSNLIYPGQVGFTADSVFFQSSPISLNILFSSVVKDKDIY